MKDIVLMEAASSTAKKKYRCPYCNDRLERAKLHIHIQNKHADLIPEGYTALRVAFNTINHKTEGHCIMCNAVTDWNEDKGRYERLCNDPKCHDAYRKMAADRNKNKYGSERLQSDPRYAEEVQRKALAGRRGSGMYIFHDGGNVSYLGTYEKRFLEFMDKVMMCKSVDIVAPGPAIEYDWEGQKHLYLPDFYYIPYNLIIEIKDGGDNPNKNPAMATYKTDRQAAKEKAVEDTHKFNYIRLTNNDFSQLMCLMATLKYNMQNECYDPVMRINESTISETDMTGTIGAALPIAPHPVPFEANKDNYYVVQHMQNNVFAYGITKDPLQYQMYSVDPQEKGFYKVFKSNKGDIDKTYLTFKIKDKQTAKELYDELALIEASGKSFHDGSLDESCSSSYIYSKLTNGSRIISEDQLMFDSRFELVKDFEAQLKEDCEKLYNYLMPSNMDILEEQVKELEEAIYG